MAILGSPLFIFVCLIPLHGILAAPNVIRSFFRDHRLPATRSNCKVLDDIVQGNYTNGHFGAGIDHGGEIVLRLLTTRANAEDICTMMYNATQKFCRSVNKQESMILLKMAKDEFKSRFGITDELCDELNKNEKLPTFSESAGYADAKDIAALIFCQLRLKIIDERKPLCDYFASPNEERSSSSKRRGVRPSSHSSSASRVRRSASNTNGTDEETNANSENVDNSSKKGPTETDLKNVEPLTSDTEGEKNQTEKESGLRNSGENEVTTVIPEMLGNEDESAPQSTTIGSQSEDPVANNDENDKKNGTVLSVTVASNLVPAVKPSTVSETNDATSTPNSYTINDDERISMDLPTSTAMEDDENDPDDEGGPDIGSRINNHPAGSNPGGSQKSLPPDDDDADDRDSDPTKNHENSPPNDGLEGPFMKKHETSPPNDGSQGTTFTKSHETLPPNDGLQGTTSTSVPPTNAAGTLLGTYTRHSIIFGLLLTCFCEFAHVF